MTESLKIEWRSDGKLWLSNNGKATAVQITKCFPWSEPDRYISLRDSDEKEVALINNLNDLEQESREAIEKALAEAGFVLEITQIESLKEDFEVRTWEARTAQGKRKFQTKLDDWPQALPGGGLLIRDVAGDLFLIDDPDKLDEISRKLLWAFVA
ncbi:MAG: DUF1854 domain-containing protein [Candidatus Hatepunaea meridiana]|nr:DUF1854 domain-containing protein [Candidatus Hatepunaea meridiana]